MTQDELDQLIKVERLRERMRRIRAIPSAKRAAAVAANGRKGGRPSRCPVCGLPARLTGTNPKGTRNVYRCTRCALTYDRRRKHGPPKVGTLTRERQITAEVVAGLINELAVQLETALKRPQHDPGRAPRQAPA